jgi:hypothetical protein
MTTPTNLYRLASVIDDWPHRTRRYKDVHVEWWVEHRSYDPGFNYEALLGQPLPPPLPHGDGHYTYEQGIVDEMFTRDEADQLAAYLKTAHNTDVTITEVPKPIPTGRDGAGFLPTGAIAVGGSSDFYMLSKHEDYDLPFSAWGYYNVTDSDTAGETA